MTQSNYFDNNYVNTYIHTYQIYDIKIFLVLYIDAVNDSPTEPRTTGARMTEPTVERLDPEWTEPRMD